MADWPGVIAWSPAWMPIQSKTGRCSMDGYVFPSVNSRMRVNPRQYPCDALPLAEPSGPNLPPADDATATGIGVGRFPESLRTSSEGFGTGTGAPRPWRLSATLSALSSAAPPPWQILVGSLGGSGL